jgi:GNAT superfamily N-acetyltransferase
VKKRSSAPPRELRGWLPNSEAVVEGVVVESIVVELARAAHADAVVELFGRADVPCFCQYFQFSGDHRDWQMRCGTDRAENARALRVELSQARLSAFVAMEGETAVGWLRLAPPAQLEKRYQGRLYRGLPCFDGDRSGVEAVVCFLVDPACRKRGVARRLLESALAYGRAQGLRSLEGFPRGATDVSDEEQWTGPVGLFEELGFRKIHDFSPYPVFRFDF